MHRRFQHDSGRRKLHDLCAIYSDRDRRSYRNALDYGQCRKWAANRGAGWHGCKFGGDDYGAIGRVDYGDDDAGRDYVFWFDYYVRGGADRDGDADGDVIFEFDYGESDSEHGGVSGRSAAGGEAADFLSGKHGNDGILAGGIWRRRDRHGAGDAAGRNWICVPAGSAGGDGIRDGGDYGGDGHWGLRKFAEESDGAGDAAGDLFYFADDVVEWQCAEFAELFDFGGEVGGGQGGARTATSKDLTQRAQREKMRARRQRDGVGSWWRGVRCARS